MMSRGACLEAGGLCGRSPNFVDGEFTACEAKLKLEADSCQVQLVEFS